MNDGNMEFLFEFDDIFINIRKSYFSFSTVIEFYEKL